MAISQSQFWAFFAATALVSRGYADDELRAAVDSALARPILAERQTFAEAQAFCLARVPRMPAIATAEQWRKQVEQYRAEVKSKVIFRGEAAGWRTAKTEVVWLETLETGAGYRIKKLRYEAAPGLWVPALLYEPENAAGKVPAVLNVNGHDAQGKAAEYKQIRCINQAKRGMLALNVEWFGMGQLHTPGFRHDLINAIDLTGTSGISVHMLMLQRGLDVLALHPNADPERMAVTGLSGGGWQTIFLSGLDARVGLTNPVAGYSSFATRVRFLSDLGDSEQTPCDLGLLVDYTHLTAMMAPKPTLLTFNANDDCCFASGHALPPLVEAANPVFRLFDAEKRLRTHVNTDPGTHNYGLDNRLALYRMIGDHFYTGDGSFVRDELPTEGEIKTEAELRVELPAENLDFASLADKLSAGLPRGNAPPVETKPLERWREEGRLRLRAIVRPFDPHTRAIKLDSREQAGVQVNRWRLRVGEAWTVPAIEFTRSGFDQTSLIIADEGRASTAKLVVTLLEKQSRVVVIDPFYFGESRINDHDYLFALLISSLGERPLGLQTGQLMVAARWLANSDTSKPIHVFSIGPRASVVTLVAAALEPGTIHQVSPSEPLDSLKRLISERQEFAKSPELFCFGLLEAFDVPQLKALAGRPD
jgi:dienelactone hydrolase